MSQQNREEESRLPRQGIWFVVSIIVGIFAAIGLVGWIWKLLR